MANINLHGHKMIVDGEYVYPNLKYSITYHHFIYNERSVKQKND